LGVCRHRAMLLKYLCDQVGIQCQLKRGMYTTNSNNSNHTTTNTSSSSSSSSSTTTTTMTHSTNSDDCPVLSGLDMVASIATSPLNAPVPSFTSNNQNNQNNQNNHQQQQQDVSMENSSNSSSTPQTNSTGPHAWNIIKLGTHYFVVDVMHEPTQLYPVGSTKAANYLSVNSEKG